jgi:tetratricopeptide (TPR) repeat protein
LIDRSGDVGHHPRPKHFGFLLVLHPRESEIVDAVFQPEKSIRGEPVESCKLRFFNSFEFFDHTGLAPAAPYELGRSGNYGWTALFPVYVRGEAYLTAQQGREAATEFQKIVDHPEIVLNSLIGALAHLQIGRAYAMQGDTAKAKAAYQDFLTLWKDADPDIPIFIAAKAEYAKLK